MDRIKSDISALEQSLDFFGVGELGHFLKGNLQDMSTRVLIKGNEIDKNKALQLLRSITHDLWNISTLIQRIEEYTNQWPPDNSYPGQLATYIGVDIEHIHIELRSIMDYTSQVIGLFYDDLSRRRFESFRKLKNNAEKSLDSPLLDLVNETEWFNSLRGVRDLFTHSGGNNIVFAPVDGEIVFQIYKSDTSKIIDWPHVMYNKNIAYFPRYISILFAYELVFLERIFGILSKRIAATHICSANLYSPGFGVIEKWIKRFLGQLENTSL